MIPVKTTVFGTFWNTVTTNVNNVNGFGHTVRKDDLGQKFLWEVHRAYTSTNTPGFRKAKRRSLPDHPHTWWDEAWYMPRTTANHWFVYSNGVVDRNAYDGPLGGYGANADESASQYPGDDPTNQAVSRLQNGSFSNERVKLAQGSLGTVIGEAGQTAHHVASTCLRLVNAVRALRKGHLGDFAQGLGITVREDKVRAYRNQFWRQKKYGSDMSQFAASTWLEYSYGWKPLLSDIHDQAENLREHLAAVNGVVRTVKASAKTVTRYEERNTRSDRLWKTWKKVDVTNRVAFTVRYGLPDGGGSLGAAFGLVNPLSVAWELVPFSFVADWFLPIGDFLEGLTAYEGLTFLSGTKATVRRAKITCGLETDIGQTAGGVRQYVDGFSGGNGENTILSKDRSLLTSFPTMGRPQFKDPRSFAHAASAIALLQSVFLGSRANKKGTSISNWDKPNSRPKKNDVFPDLYSHL